VNKVNYDREATLAKRIRLLPPDETNDFLKLQVQKIPLLSPTEQETVLYFKRSGLGDLFQRLVNPVDENGDYENIFLIGNPGSGKSNLLWWVAHHLANTKKQTVLWLGRRLTSGNFTVRLFEVDETSGQSSIVEIHNAPSTVKDIMSLQIMSKVNVVILDALTTVKSHTEAVGEQALAWALEDRKNRRVIHSSSLRAFSLDDRILEEKHLVNLRMRPWTRPDYVESMADPDLKAQVCRTVNLAPNEVSNEEVVDSKLFYCGINARWFFNYSVDKIKSFSQNVVDKLTPDSTDGGVASATAVNSAFTTMWVNERRIKIITSEYLAFLMGGDASYAKKFFEAFPIMKDRLGNGAPGEVFEADFLVNLEHCHKLAEAEYFFLRESARQLNVLLGTSMGGQGKVYWPVGKLLDLPKNPTNDVTASQPIGIDGSNVSGLGGVLWFIPLDNSQPFLDFFVLIYDGSKWELRIVQNTVSKRHTKATDEDQLKRVLRGLEEANFERNPKVLVAYIVETSEQWNVGSSFDGKTIKVPVSGKDSPEKEFNVAVAHVVYERSGRAGPSFQATARSGIRRRDGQAVNELRDRPSVSTLNVDKRLVMRSAGR